jgi:hypothetical protein
MYIPYTYTDSLGGCPTIPGWGWDRDQFYSGGFNPGIGIYKPGIQNPDFVETVHILTNKLPIL